LNKQSNPQLQILDFYSLFYYGPSHDNLHQWVSVGMAKNTSLAVCHAFKIDRNAIQTAGAIHAEKYSALRTTAAILWKNIFIFKDDSSF